MVTFTKRRVYVILFFARPLGVFFFSWGSTWWQWVSEDPSILHQTMQAAVAASGDFGIDDAPWGSET